MSRAQKQSLAEIRSTLNMAQITGEPAENKWNNPGIHIITERILKLRYIPTHKQEKAKNNRQLLYTNNYKQMTTTPNARFERHGTSFC